MVQRDLGIAIMQLKREAGHGLFLAGVKIALPMAELDLIDQYEFVVHPRLAGHGPSLFTGVSKYVDLNLIDRREFSPGAVALRYEPKAGVAGAGIRVKYLGTQRGLSFGKLASTLRSQNPCVKTTTRTIFDSSVSTRTMSIGQ